MRADLFIALMGDSPCFQKTNFMICIKNICQFFCIGEIRSILGCAIGIVILVPVAVLFALPVGLVVGGWIIGDVVSYVA
jgi:hypothetical protein